MADSQPNGDFEDSPERLSAESKVGLFVLAGLGVLMISILLLGDIHFRPQTTVHVLFKSVEGISDKSPVKIYGVEVGSVKKIQLSEGKAQVTIQVRKEIRLYKNAKARIKSTGIIGTKYLALDPGTVEPGIPEDDQRLNNGDTLIGEDALDLEELVERVTKSLDQFTGDGSLAKNLNGTFANLKSITDSLNAAIGMQRRQMVNIVNNIEGFSSHAKSVAANIDEVLKHSKEEIKVAIHNLKETLERMNTILAGVQKGEGMAGAIVSNKESGENFKQTMSNLKEASESAKEVLSRFTRVRAFWQIGLRRDFKAGVYRGDFGMRIEPRSGKFYELRGENLGSSGSSDESVADFERRNTLTALLGYDYKYASWGIGVIKSRAGGQLLLRPFEGTSLIGLNRLELLAQGFDFGRDAIIKDRHFDEPNYTAGARFKLNNWLMAGVQQEDMAETSHLHGTLNLSFEDKDIAYLFGFVSFAR